MLQLPLCAQPVIHSVMGALVLDQPTASSVNLQKCLSSLVTATMTAPVEWDILHSRMWMFARLANLGVQCAMVNPPTAPLARQDTFTIQEPIPARTYVPPTNTTIQPLSPVWDVIPLVLNAQMALPMGVKCAVLLVKSWLLTKVVRQIVGLDHLRMPSRSATLVTLTAPTAQGLSVTSAVGAMPTTSRIPL